VAYHYLTTDISGQLRNLGLKVGFEDLPDDYVSVEINMPYTTGAKVQNGDLDIH
jgi:hypothetical protein